ncbi:MAG: C10 family peptidase [Planctomycetes bacterium]|nr:C10 family peptidase [Planctomycetota bacterium]
MRARAPSITLLSAAIGLSLGHHVRAEVPTDTEMAQVCQNWLTYIVHERGSWGGTTEPLVGEVQEIVAGDLLVGRCYTIRPRGYVVVPALKELLPVKAYSTESVLDMSATDGLPEFVRDILRIHLTSYIAKYGSAEAIPSARGDVSFGREERQEWDRFVLPPEHFRATLERDQLSCSGAWCVGNAAGQVDPRGLKPAARHVTETGSALDSRAAASTTTVGPLLTTLWHQYSPYNKFCPEGDGGQTLAGCVAAATAQVMNYHQWPVSGVGSSGYVWDGDDSCDPGNPTAGETLWVDLSDPYDWANMPADCSAGCTTAQEEAVAELNYEVGVVFQMDWGFCGSGAYFLPNRFAEKFKYARNVERVGRGDYTSVEWFDLIRTQIDAGWPMVHMLCTAVAGGTCIGAHAVACDGWQIVGKYKQYHINYGWRNGQNTGWFTVDNMPGTVNPLDEEYLYRNISPQAAPVAVCPEVTIRRFADGDCCAELSVADIDGGSFDPNGATDISEICITAVDGTPVGGIGEPTSVQLCGAGEHSVTLSVTDLSMASDSCEATVLVRDLIIPQAECTITNAVQPIEVNGDCKASVEFSITVSDNCLVDPADVAIRADLLTANATLAPVELDPLPLPGSIVTITGHVPISELTCCPAEVGLRCDAVDDSGRRAEPCATIAKVVDNYPPAGACGLTRDHPGWNWMTEVVALTADEPTYWSSLTGEPASTSPFPLLDSGSLPGRPDTESPDANGRVVRGYVLAWAVNAAGEEVSWNYLHGKAVVVDYRGGSAWEYNGLAFQALGADVGAATGSPGVLNLDGTEYDAGFDKLLLDFYAVGTGALSTDLRSVAVDTRLTLLLVDMDLRAGSGGPISTTAAFEVWNMNEVKFSGPQRCITGWDQTWLADYEPPDHFLTTFLGTDKGKARIDGMADVGCPDSMASPLLGVSMKRIIFDAGADYAAAGSPVTGIDAQAATIQADIPVPFERPSSMSPSGTDAKASVESGGTNLDGPGSEYPASARAFVWRAAGFSPRGFAQAGEHLATERPEPNNEFSSIRADHVAGAGTGSLLVFPNVEVRWDSCGSATQDTFIELTNDYPGDILVRMYFVNGDPPEEASLPQCSGTP